MLDGAQGLPKRESPGKPRQVLGYFLHLIKVSTKKPMANIILVVICWEFSLWDQEDKGDTMTNSIQHCTRGLSQCNEARERNKHCKYWKEKKYMIDHYSWTT